MLSPSPRFLVILLAPPLTEAGIVHQSFDEITRGVCDPHTIRGVLCLGEAICNATAGIVLCGLLLRVFTLLHDIQGFLPFWGHLPQVVLVSHHLRSLQIWPLPAQLMLLSWPWLNLSMNQLIPAPVWIKAWYWIHSLTHHLLSPGTHDYDDGSADTHMRVAN